MAVSWEYEGIHLPSIVTKESLDQVRNFQVRHDDIWLCTYPKSGTHWLIQVIQLLRFNGEINQIPGSKDCPIFEVVSSNPDGSHEYSFKYYEQLPSPRLIVTHLPLTLLPKQLFEKRAKVIYFARNPKDVTVSMYHFTKPLLKEMNVHLEWESFLETILLSDKAVYGPWATHVLPFWNRRNEDSVLFLKYEDFKKDTMKNIRDVAIFTNLPTTENVLQKTTENSSVEKTKTVMDNKATQTEHTKQLNIGAFVRKGIVGDWKSQFTVAQSQQVDEVLSNYMRETGLEMTYE